VGQDAIERTHPAQFIDAAREQQVRGELVGQEVGAVERHHPPTGLGEMRRRAGAAQPAAHDHHIAPFVRVLFVHSPRHQDLRVEGSLMPTATVVKRAQT
jgi:hypothetical protein